SAIMPESKTPRLRGASASSRSSFGLCVWSLVTAWCCRPTRRELCKKRGRDFWKKGEWPLFCRPIVRRRSFAAVVLGMGVAFAQPADAKDDVQRVEASGVVDGSQISAGGPVRNPLDEALKNAVEQVAKPAVGDAQWTARQADIDEKILKNASVYVRDYQ